MNLDDYLDDFRDEVPNDAVEVVEDQQQPEEVHTEEPEVEIPESTEVTTEEVVAETDDESKVYFEALKEYGVLDLPEDFKFEGPDSLEAALETTKTNIHNKVVNNLWNSLPPDFQPLLEYALRGGTSLEDYLQAYAPTDYEYDLEDTISQKEIIKEYYRQTNPRLTDEKLDQMVARREAAGSLREEAEDALQLLDELKEERKVKLIEDLEAQKAQQEALQKQKDEEIKNSIDKFANDSIRRNRLKNFVFTPIKKGEVTTTEFNESLNHILNNYDHLVQLVDILADYDVRVGFNFDRLNKRIKTETTKTYKELVNNKLDSKSSVRGNASAQIKEDIDWDKYFGKK